MAYLKEETITRFLEIPDIFGVSPVLFQMLSYLGAFPFGQEAPVILGFRQMLVVVVLLTERYQRVLKRGGRDRVKLLFQSLAIYDRKPAKGGDDDDVSSPGFVVDRSREEEEEDDEEEDDDDLALAALESLDAIEVFKLGNIPVSDSSIPPDNLKKVIMLMLLVAPLQEQQSLAQLLIEPENLEKMRCVADHVLSAFLNVESTPSVKFSRFNQVVAQSLPYLFNGFSPLFSRFLFSKNLDFNKHRSDAAISDAAVTRDSAASSPLPPPLLPSPGSILDSVVLAQLSFSFPPANLFHRLLPLYSGSTHGFSLRSFETKVFNWRAPSLILVSGTLLPASPSSTTETTFSDLLPPKRFPTSTSSSTSTRFIFGAYVSQPWRLTHKDCFGDADTKLFQLAPTHEIFSASHTNREYVTFTSTSSNTSQHAGIALGCPPPKPITAGLSPHLVLGSVSLYLDASFEFGVFTHHHSAGGGAFHESKTRRRNWQDRFEIEDVEVWGLGGEEEAKKQREAWKWEEREAEARRRVNLGSGDRDMDRALLEMAGVIGGGRSGGSMA